MGLFFLWDFVGAERGGPFSVSASDAPEEVLSEWAWQGAQYKQKPSAASAREP